MAKDSWLTVNPMTGEGDATLTNSGTIHKGRLERQIVVTAVVKGIEAAKSYQVKQEPTAEYITLDKTSFEVGEGASTITVSGKSNSPKITFTLGSGNDIPIVLPANYTVNGLLTVNGTSIPDDPGAVDEFIFSAQIPIPKNTVGQRTGKITVTGSIASVVGTVTVTQATSTWTVTYSKGDYINTINKTSEKINWGNTATAVATLLANTAQYTYSFLGWYEGSTQISSSLSLSVANITANRTFTAIGSRTLNRYTLAFTITPTGAGTVSGGGTYDYGSSIKSTATTATGYNFTKWVDEEGVESTTNPYPGWAITKNRTIQAVFTIKSYAINLAAQYRVGESGAFTSGTTGGTVSGGGTFNHGTSVTAKATPATGYSFAGWYDGISKVSDSTSYAFTATGARSLTARFQRQWLTVTFTAGTGGSVSPTTARVQYGGEASSTATASTGHTFSGWSNGVKTAKLTVTNVTANATYAASFGINTYVITYAKGTGIASVTPASETVENGVNAKGSTAELTTGYNFDGWYNGDTRVSTTLTYGPTNVTGNMTLTAKGVIKTFAVTGTAQYRDTDSTGSFTSGTNLSGAAVKYFNQTATTDVSGNVSLYRSSVTNTVSATATYHGNYSGSITSSSASPFNVTMLRNKHVVTIKFVEGLPSGEIVGPIVNRISYSSDAGNGTFETNDEGIAQVSVYFNIPITFSILDNKSYYGVTTSTQSITFTESNTIKTIVAVMIQPINIKVVNDNDTTIVVDGAKVSYNGQIATTNADGVAALYRSGSNVDKNISVSANNYNIFNGVITTETVSPYQVRLQFISTRATLKVVEMIPDGKGGYIEGGVYANQKLQYRSGSFNYEITTSDEGLYVFNRVGTAQIRFNVVGHPEFYENPENTFAYTDFPINEVTVLQLKCSAKITINVKSNVPSESNGGTVTGSGTYNYGSKSTLTAAAKAGYTFQGWYDAGGTQISTSATYEVTSVTAAVTVYARFQKNWFTVTYVRGTGVNALTKTTERVAYNGTVTSETAVASTGYNTPTWTKTSGTGTLTVTAGKATLSGVQSNCTLTASATINKYTVSYTKNANIASISKTSESVNYGGTATCTATLPANTAEYTTTTYTVTYVKGTGIAKISKTSETVSWGANATKCTATVTKGYTFDGWYNGTTRVSTSLTYAPTAVKSNLSLTAKANIKSYTVIPSAYYRTTDGTGNYTAGTTGGTVSGGGIIYHGGSITVTASAAAGYKFDGWYSDGASGGTLLSSSASYAISGVTASMTVYARFTRIYYTITYSAGDYVASLSRTTERVAHGANAAGSTMTVNGTTAQYSYGVDGWYSGSTRVTSSATYAPTGVTANATYTAKGTRSLRSYTVTYNKNAYIASVSRASESVNYGSNAAGSTATVMASDAQFTYGFDGWYNGSTRVSTAVTYAPTSITGELTLEARGTRTTKSYTISVSLDSSAAGRGSVSGGGSYAYGASATVKCTKTNSQDVFDGWYEGSTRVSTSLSYQFTVTGARTLVAKILYLDVTPTSLSYGATGGSQTFKITTNTSWKIS